MRAEIVHPAELGPAEIERWRALQRADPRLRSPFLGPSFARAVGAARAETRVAVLDGGAGFFAFQRGPGRIGTPLGQPLGDYQGLVARRGLPWSARELVRACGLRSYSFDHVLMAQEPWRPAVRLVERSPVLEFARFDPETDMPSGAARQARRLRRLGEPRFVWHDPGPAALEALVGWKRAQHARTALGKPWVGDVVRRLHASAEEDLTGVLGCLYDGGTLIAACLLLRAGPLLHGWIQAYAPEHATYSPGLVLLREILLAAPARGVEALDLGKGTEGYKGRLATGANEVGAGSVQAGPIWRAAAGAWRHARNLPDRLSGRT